MSPIVISNIAIIFLDTQQPTAKHLVVDVKTLDKVQIEEHAEAGLKIKNIRVRQLKINIFCIINSIMRCISCYKLDIPSEYHRPQNVYHRSENRVSGNAQLMAHVNAGMKEMK